MARPMTMLPDAYLNNSARKLARRWGCTTRAAYFYGLRARRRAKQRLLDSRPDKYWRQIAIWVQRIERPKRATGPFPILSTIGAAIVRRGGEAIPLLPRYRLIEPEIALRAATWTYRPQRLMRMCDAHIGSEIDESGACVVGGESKDHGWTVVDETGREWYRAERVQ